MNKILCYDKNVGPEKNIIKLYRQKEKISNK